MEKHIEKLVNKNLEKITRFSSTVEEDDLLRQAISKALEDMYNAGHAQGYSDYFNDHFANNDDFNDDFIS